MLQTSPLSSTADSIPQLPPSLRWDLPLGCFKPISPDSWPPGASQWVSCLQIYPPPTQCILHAGTRKSFPKCNLGHVTFLPNTSQWVSVILRVKPKFLHIGKASQAVWPLAASPPCFYHRVMGLQSSPNVPSFSCFLALVPAVAPVWNLLLPYFGQVLFLHQRRISEFLLIRVSQSPGLISWHQMDGRDCLLFSAILLFFFISGISHLG